MPLKTAPRRSRFIAVVAASLAAACSPHADLDQPSQALPAPDNEVQRLGEAFIAADQADALSVAIIEQGNVRFLNFGTISRSSAMRPDSGTVYEIGSITKVFTSLLLAQAVVEQRVDLQDDIRQYLPGDYPNLEWQGEPVRLVHLAETTSALPDNIPDLEPFIEEGGPSRAPFLISERWSSYSNDDFLTDLRSATLIDRPGTTPRHSNVAATLLGIILERVYNDRYETLVSRFIEQPAGMKSGSLEVRASDLATGYSGRGVAMPALDNRYILSAGGLRYSSADMAKFVQAQLRADGKAIRLSQQATMKYDQGGLGFNWRFAIPADGTHVLRASGGTFGSSSYVEIRPERDYGIVLLANRTGAENALYLLAEKAWQVSRTRQHI
ncbi:serine hydrolase domain-containing protein [Porphyrobacter sp. ULC335]|jgi:serine-type D-Ala-D-Ala carboxypeptidase/endopeptidase|uniref:serine hydrolase domain-containing protein n=1 Tax=Porphyrobacter sp. ULC335 TaxID=2854260 RepID=UPI00221E4E25|nr:serine hydrolase domain-containing protein [Porphyrobacter sp. ULC335]UYV15609.1 beta-lactamase family protein [Porphyrobacter sp. ULC335]